MWAAFSGPFHPWAPIQSNPEIRKIAFVGDYVPRQCGIATFTHDLREAVAGQYPEAECFVVPVHDVPGGYDYPPEVRFEFAENDPEAYQRAADYLNFNNVDVVCLQHEYGIYGGPAGGLILTLLRSLRIPVVTTLHTILLEPSPGSAGCWRRSAPSPPAWWSWGARGRRH